jgi:hypothetical protein
MLMNCTQLMFVNPKSWVLIPALISAIFLLLYNFVRVKSKLDMQTKTTHLVKLHFCN